MKSFILSLMVVAGSSSFAGGLKCTPEGCIAVCGSVGNCQCNPAEGYKCGDPSLMPASIFEQVLNSVGPSGCPSPLPPGWSCRELRAGRYCFPTNPPPGHSGGGCIEHDF